MSSVLLVIHLIIAIALVATVLLQRSEGGALGIGGGGGGGGGLFSGRGAANALTRATAVLAALFFVTSILLTILARGDGTPGSILDAITPGTSSEQPADTPSESVLPQLPGSESEPAKPEAPAQN
ncbi:MAG: preprotein translocase subunit SecG [Hyphomicrobiales bacterium]